MYYDQYFIIFGSLSFYSAVYIRHTFWCQSVKKELFRSQITFIILKRSSLAISIIYFYTCAYIFFCVHLHIGSFFSTAFCDHGPFILITNHWFQRFGSNQFCLDLLFILNHITKKVWNIYILGFVITCKCKNNQAFEQGFVFIDLKYSF